MWEMMRMNPFAAAMPGGSSSMGPSLSMMSDMLAPLTNVEELDKRIKDMRAVEQWLKLNLNMLQSAIQALEVQRATLATLRAFGAYAQSSMEKAPSTPGWPSSSAPETPKASDTARDDRADTNAPEAGANDAAFDPSGWWNMLQSQFNQLASLAMTQTGAAAAPQDSSEEDQQASPSAEDASATKKTSSAAKKAPAKKKPA
jgi:hypothetical protein